MSMHPVLSRFKQATQLLHGTLQGLDNLMKTKRVKDPVSVIHSLQDMDKFLKDESAKIDPRALYDGRLNPEKSLQAVNSLLEDLAIVDDKLKKLYKASKFFKGDSYFQKSALTLLKHLNNSLVLCLAELIPRLPTLVPPYNPTSPSKAVTAPVEMATSPPGSSIEEELSQIKEEPSERDPWAATVAAAEANSADEGYVVGHAFLTGEGLPQEETPDGPKALYYLDKAARAGSGPALHLLGRLYEQGDPKVTGSESGPDLRRARECYERAANEFHLRSAMTDLAYFLEHGIGGEVDYVSAAILYSRAGQLGCAVATNNLATMTLQGRGIEASPSRAFELFMIASHGAGDRSSASAVAFNNLGLCYQEGVGVGRDGAAAESCFEQAARQGHVPAILNFARSLGGRGRPSAALNMLREAFLSEGSAEAAYLLAAFQENIHFSTPIDIEGSLTTRASSLVAPEGFRSAPPPRLLPLSTSAAPLGLLPSTEDIGALYRYAADAGVPGALVKTASQAWDKGFQLDAVLMYRAAAEKGHSGAFETLAAIYASIDPKFAKDLLACSAGLGRASEASALDALNEQKAQSAGSH